MRTKKAIQSLQKQREYQLNLVGKITASGGAPVPWMRQNIHALDVAIRALERDVEYMERLKASGEFTGKKNTAYWDAQYAQPAVREDILAMMGD